MNSIKETKNLEETDIIPGDIFKYENETGYVDYFLVSAVYNPSFRTTEEVLISLKNGICYSNNTEDPFDGKRDKYFSKIDANINLTIRLS